MTKTQKTQEKQGRNIKPLYIEMTKNALSTKVFISSVDKIETLTLENILLKISRGAIKIRGENLNLSILENKSVEITGNVLAVEFI